MSLVPARPPSTRRGAAMFAVVVLCLVCARAPEAVAADTLSRADLVRAAYTICARASNEIARVRPAFTLAASAKSTSAVVASLSRAVNGLAALSPRSPDRRLRTYVRLMRAEIGALHRAARAARRGDQTTFRESYLSAAAISLKARAVARSIGLEVCSTL